MTKPVHHIAHRHENGLGIVATFTCTGTREDKCHIYPDCECESWPDTAEHAKAHPSVPHDRCWVEVWMNDADCAELCGPDEEPVRDGPITITYEDCVQWEYAQPLTTEWAYSYLDGTGTRRHQPTGPGDMGEGTARRATALEVPRVALNRTVESRTVTAWTEAPRGA